MNELVRKFGDRLQVLAFPCNQFGHQENGDEQEILNTLKYVRPGNGYEPEYPVFSKIQVNGSGAHPLFVFLRESLPAPADNPKTLMVHTDNFIWTPVCRSDISWNFEKFIVRADGVPFRRYSPKYETRLVQKDIEELIKL